MININDFTYEMLIEEMVKLGEKKYRAKQLFSWLYQKQVTSFSMMSDIKKDFINYLSENYYITDLIVKTKQVSKDGTVKFLFELSDGSLIETVLMRFDYGNSLCITSQVGCNMGCKFCASGLLKKKRDLSAGEMIAQVNEAIRYLNVDNERLSNLVIMGTGEPFDNYDEIMNFCSILNDPNGIALGARHITISTCGLSDKIKKFADEEKQYNLAISLHAPNDELRSELMPINVAFPLSSLINSLKYYDSKSNRKITFEYIMLKDINDHREEAIQLANLIRGLEAYVNLIPYNAVSENGYQGSDEKTILKFYDTLMKHGVKATIRNRVGDDIDAACGQLRAKVQGKL